MSACMSHVASTFLKQFQWVSPSAKNSTRHMRDMRRKEFLESGAVCGVSASGIFSAKKLSSGGFNTQRNFAALQRRYETTPSRAKWHKREKENRNAKSL